QRAVHPYLLGGNVNAERFSTPENHDGILDQHERADSVVKIQRPYRIDRDPPYGFLDGNVEAEPATLVHRLRRLLVQALRTRCVIGVDDGAHARVMQDGRVAEYPVHRLLLEVAPVGPYRSRDGVLG